MLAVIIEKLNDYCDISNISSAIIRGTGDIIKKKMRLLLCGVLMMDINISYTHIYYEMPSCLGLEP